MWQILQATAPSRYSLSQTACLGILRRAECRGKSLPPLLEAALRMQAGLDPPAPISGEAKAYHISQRNEGIDLDGVSGALMATQDLQMQTFITNPGSSQSGPQKQIAFAANQRDEVRDLHDIAGALQASPGMKQQTFVAGFSAGAGASAGGIGYNESVAPTLKGSPSGNCMPSILHVDRREKIYENHGIDARYTGPYDVAPTVTARYGTGGNNTPLVESDADCICIAGNIIDRQPENGGNGCGYQQDLAYTLTALDGTRSLRASAWTSSRRMILPARRAHGRSRMLRIWLQNRNGNMRSSFEDLLHGNANSFKGSRWGGQISRPRRTLPDTVPSATVLPSRVWSSLCEA